MDILGELRKKLQSISDPKVRESGERYFKEHVSLYGIKSADVTAIAKEYLQLCKSMQKNEVFKLCEELWKSGFIEESFIACHWAYSLKKQFIPDDFLIFKHWVHTYISNWASCDTFCNHTLGEFIMKYPDFLNELKLWTGSDNRWVKRASAVTLIIPARKGLFLEDIFTIAENLLLDKDDMVQKGYGWMLKAASQAHCQAVFDFVMKHKTNMPRTALRYAIEKMPADLKQKAMKK